MSYRNNLSIFVLFSLLSGCAGVNSSLVYKIDIAQGNIVSEEQLAQLQQGMSQDQVVFLLGHPLLQDPFHSNRWDYYYSFTPGHGKTEQRHLVLFFEKNMLSSYEINGETSAQLAQE